MLDYDILPTPDADQTLVVWSAVPGAPEGLAGDLFRVTGTERFTC